MKGFTTAPKNKLQQGNHELTRDSKSPVDEQQRISYGIIDEVDDDTSQVRVKFLREDGIPGELITPSFLPLATPLSEVYLLWGMLRKGLVCRIYWKGKIQPRKAIVEVIGDETHTILNQAPHQNEITIGPWKIFT